MWNAPTEHPIVNENDKKCIFWKPQYILHSTTPYNVWMFPHSRPLWVFLPGWWECLTVGTRMRAVTGIRWVWRDGTHERGSPRRSHVVWVSPSTDQWGIVWGWGQRVAYPRPVTKAGVNHRGTGRDEPAKPHLPLHLSPSLRGLSQPDGFKTHAANRKKVVPNTEWAPMTWQGIRLSLPYQVSHRLKVFTQHAERVL